MPFVEVPAFAGAGSEEVTNTKPVQIYYRTYGQGDIKVVFIMGFAAGGDAWLPQVEELAGTLDPNEKEDKSDEVAATEESKTLREDAPGDVPEGRKDETWQHEVTCLIFDNRGVGRSSAPEDKRQYTTRIMAHDALALMDRLGWEKAHVVGHSMGGMIAGKLAAVAPNRVCSLAMVSVSGGGYHAVPRISQALLALAYRFARARTPQDRAKVDLDAHYSKAHLEDVVDGRKRREVLYEKYVRNLSIGGLQSKHGVDGHLHACWHHRLSREDRHAIRSGDFLVSVIHGKNDVIAHIRAAERVALTLHPVSRMVSLAGGHMITMEKPKMVNQHLKELIAASQQGVHPVEWIKESALWDKIRQEGVGEVENSDALFCCFYACPSATKALIGTCVPPPALSSLAYNSHVSTKSLIRSCGLSGLCGPHSALSYFFRFCHVSTDVLCGQRGPHLLPSTSASTGVLKTCYWSCGSHFRLLSLLLRATLEPCFGQQLKLSAGSEEEDEESVLEPLRAVGLAKTVELSAPNIVVSVRD